MSKQDKRKGEHSPAALVAGSAAAELGGHLGGGLLGLYMSKNEKEFENDESMARLLDSIKEQRSAAGNPEVNLTRDAVPLWKGGPARPGKAAIADPGGHAVFSNIDDPQALLHELGHVANKEKFSSRMRQEGLNTVKELYEKKQPPGPLFKFMSKYITPAVADIPDEVNAWKWAMKNAPEAMKAGMLKKAILGTSSYAVPYLGRIAGAGLLGAAGYYTLKGHGEQE
jgi:hypothetical protein